MKTSDEGSGGMHQHQQHQQIGTSAMNIFATSSLQQQQQQHPGSMMPGSDNPMDIRLSQAAIAQWLHQAQQQQQQQRSHSPVKDEPIDGDASPHSGHSGSSDYAAL